jgi:hypothetical protein
LAKKSEPNGLYYLQQGATHGQITQQNSLQRAGVPQRQFSLGTLGLISRLILDLCPFLSQCFFTSSTNAKDSSEKLCKFSNFHCNANVKKMISKNEWASAERQSIGLKLVLIS